MRLIEFLKNRLLSTAMLLSCLGLLSVAHTISTARATRPGDLESGPGISVDSHPSFDGIVAEGRVVTYPDRQATAAFETGGRIVRLAVAEGQSVHRGELIAQIDADEAQAQLAELTARVVEIDADIRMSEIKLQKVADLSSRGAATLLQAEQQRHDVAADRARRDAASAQLDRIRVQLKRSSIFSPIDGVIIARFVHPFEVVQAASPVVTIADLQHMRIEAEVNEFDAADVAAGAPAFVTAEGFPGIRWPAVVEEVPQVVVTRQLRPQDPGRPTDTGVVLVKLSLREPTPLKLGRRVEVTIQRSAAPAVKLKPE